MTVPEPDAWPLSAAATLLLRQPVTKGGAVLRLALRELVVRDVVRVVDVRNRRMSPPRLTLAPGVRPPDGLPAPLPVLAAALLPRLADSGTDASEAFRGAQGWRGDLAARLLTDTRTDLEGRRLLERHRERLAGLVPLTRWRPTPSGQAWGRAPDALSRTAQALPAAGLLLLLDDEVVRDLRRRWAESGGDTAPLDVDLDALDSVGGDVGAGLDASVDGGAGGGAGDGGDGGGAGD